MFVYVVSLDFLQVQVAVYCSRWILAHLRCNHCSILLHYLSVADISNPDLLACGCQTWNSLDITHFYEEQCPKTINRAPIAGDRRD